MHTLSAKKLHQGFVEGKFSAEEISTHFLQRIKGLDGNVRAFTRVLEEEVLQAAKVLDEKRRTKQPLGKLAGVPIAIKDNIHIRGQITTCGSRFLENYRAPFAATVVERLLEEDALLIGKTNMDEFAMGSSSEHSAFFCTHNPWNLECTPGGSSGGSAAAVAARMVPIALGSDTGGSIRQPAAFCGLVGFKPTYGRVSRYGLVAFGSSLDQIGPLTTNVEDTALAMEVIGTHCKRDSTSRSAPPDNYKNLAQGIKGMRIGIPRKLLEDLSPEMAAHFAKMERLFCDLGATTVDITLDLIRHSVAVYYIIAPAEASTNLARFDGIRYGVRAKDAHNLDEVYNLSKEFGYGKEVKRRILLGTYVLSSGHQKAYYRKAQTIRTLMIEEYRQAFSQADLIAMPTTATAAFPFGSIKDPLSMYLQDLYTISANLTGTPAVSVPIGFTEEKMPIGIQLVGPQNQEERVLQGAFAMKKALNLDTLPEMAR